MVWWKIVLIAVGGLVGLIVFVSVVGGLFLLRYRREQPSKREVLRPEAGEPEGSALIVYQPGGIGYAEDVAYAIAAGLKSAGWEVHLDRANKETAADLGSFDLLCVGSPTWADSPLPPVVKYIARCAGLEGKPAAVFATGSLDAGPANDRMKSELRKRGASVGESLALLTKIRGEEAERLAREFGRKLARAAKE